MTSQASDVVTSSHVTATSPRAERNAGIPRNKYMSGDDRNCLMSRLFPVSECQRAADQLSVQSSEQIHEAIVRLKQYVNGPCPQNAVITFLSIKSSPARKRGRRTYKPPRVDSVAVTKIHRNCVPDIRYVEVGYQQ